MTIDSRGRGVWLCYTLLLVALLMAAGLGCSDNSGFTSATTVWPVGDAKFLREVAIQAQTDNGVRLDFVEPNELLPQGPKSFTVDEDDDTVWVLDTRSDRVVVYDWAGEHRRTIPIPGITEQMEDGFVARVGVPIDITLTSEFVYVLVGTDGKGFLLVQLTKPTGTLAAIYPISGVLNDGGEFPMWVGPNEEIILRAGPTEAVDQAGDWPRFEVVNAKGEFVFTRLADTWVPGLPLDETGPVAKNERFNPDEYYYRMRNRMTPVFTDTITWQGKTNVFTRNRDGGFMPLRVFSDGSFLAKNSQNQLGDEGYLADWTIDHFSQDGERIRSTRVWLDNYVPPLIPFKTMPSGRVYSFSVHKDKAVIRELGFVKELVPILPSVEETWPRPDELSFGTSAQYLIGGPCVHRADMIATAMSYRDVSFSVSSGNITGAGCSSRTRPANITNPGTYTGVSYSWGGNQTVAAFTSAIAAGGAVGDVDMTLASPSGCGKGIDCSGFVGRCWVEHTKRSTSTFEYSAANPGGYGARLSRWNVLRQGDALNRSGHHIVLIDTQVSAGNYWVYHAYGDGRYYDRVVRSRTGDIGITCGDPNSIAAPGTSGCPYVPLRYLNVCEFAMSE